MMAMDNVNRRRNLGFFFDHATARVPDKVAIIDLFGGRERCSTYRQLDARMDAVAWSKKKPRLRRRFTLSMAIITSARQSQPQRSSPVNVSLGSSSHACQARARAL